MLYCMEAVLCVIYNSVFRDIITVCGIGYLILIVILLCNWELTPLGTPSYACMTARSITQRFASFPSAYLAALTPTRDLSQVAFKVSKYSNSVTYNYF